MAMSMGEHPLWHNFFRTSGDKHARIAELWGQTTLFNGVSRRARLELAAAMHPRQFNSGESIFEIGLKGAGALLIVSGRVEIRAGEAVLAELGTGDFFGEVALLEEEVRSATAVAAEPSELAFFMRADFEQWMRRCPAEGAVFMTNLARVLASRLRHANTMLGAASGH